MLTEQPADGTITSAPARRQGRVIFRPLADIPIAMTPPAGTSLPPSPPAAPPPSPPPPPPPPPAPPPPPPPPPAGGGGAPPMPAFLADGGSAGGGDEPARLTGVPIWLRDHSGEAIIPVWSDTPEPDPAAPHPPEPN